MAVKKYTILVYYTPNHRDVWGEMKLDPAWSDARIFKALVARRVLKSKTKLSDVSIKYLAGALFVDDVKQKLPILELDPEFDNPSSGRAFTINNADREQWIDNDEGLYNWWRSSRLSKREFIRENNVELDAAIRRAVGR